MLNIAFKIKEKIYRIPWPTASLLAGVFILGSILWTGFFYWNYYVVDDLAKFAPGNVAVFIQIKQPISLSYSFNLTDLSLSETYATLDNFMGWEFSFKKDVLPFVNKQAALVITADKKNIIIFKAKERAEAERLFKNYNIYWLKDNIAAVAFKEVDLVEIFKGFDQNNLSYKLKNRFSNFGLVKIYINFNQVDFFQDFKRFQDAIIIINRKENHWQYNLIFGKNFEEDTNNIKGSSGLINFLPDNYLFFARNISAPALTLFSFFKNDATLNFFESEVLPLVNNNFDLLLFASTSPEKINYALAITLKDESSHDLFIKEFNQLIAFNRPNKIKRFLPDGSSVTELSASVTFYDFQKINRNVYFLENDDFQIGFKILSKKDFVFSNSRDYLENSRTNVYFEKWQEMDLKINKCWSDYPFRYLLINKDINVGFKEIFVKINFDGSFSGCLY